ncbi:MAG: hypothetical protein Q4F72_12285, partial [Desulfovibrionaceae bacterium]|nr:hypothetical protein [Desulfovibrionaceae bacterium]
MRAGRENFAGQDLLIAAGLLVFAVIVHFGRIGASIGGVDLETDVAMYCSIAAAWGHPEIFAPDFSFGTAANFATHV